jgi:BlaI family transcriptional regulator, penicillinase repressor
MTAASNSLALRHSLFDLAPLELECLNILWPLGDATVRDIRDALASRRPRAYTTIMTIMDRLARKGVVHRRKAGRAYIYRANLTASDARSQALFQVIQNFFAGSKEAALAHLQHLSPDFRAPERTAPPAAAQQPDVAHASRRALAAAAGSSASAPARAQSTASADAPRPSNPNPSARSRRSPNSSPDSDASTDAAPIDDTLL